MAAPTGMEIYAARLNSFETAKSTNGRRASKAKSAKAGPKWPHSAPSTTQVAQTGFYFDPSQLSPDNVTCYHCLRSLDGWESEDIPAKEHLAFSPDCAIAILTCIEKDLEDEKRDLENPMSERMVEARKATFGDMWPHDDKKGWVCKTKKMVDAGWYYSPTVDNDDFVKCAYCSLSLDGWEPKDKPIEEHKRRSPECVFFSFAKPTKAQKGKRGSTILADGSIDTAPKKGKQESVMVADDSTVSAPKRGKRGSTMMEDVPLNASKKRGKRGSAISVDASVAAPARRATRTRSSSVVKPKATRASKAITSKRDSNEMDLDDASDFSETAPPAPSKRRTRASSILPQPTIPVHEEEKSLDVLEPPEDSEVEPAPVAKAPKASKRSKAKTTKPVPIAVSRKRSSIEMLDDTPDEAPAPPKRTKAKNGPKGSKKKISVEVYKEPSPKVLREPTPEVLREPTPEVEMEPAPEIEKEPSPEIEGKRSPVFLREPTAAVVLSPEPKITTPPPVAAREKATKVRKVSEQQLSPSPSPQSSDAENQPPTAQKVRIETPPARTPLAPKNGNGRLQTTHPWTAVDLENEIFASEKSLAELTNTLTSPEKKMTVEEWIQFNATKSEQDLRTECERMVGRFEDEGNRALQTLEGLVCA